MPLVTRWTGRETKALREALRMTTAEMGDKLGVSDRIVARWEASCENASIRPINQAALDTLLAMSDRDVHGRFAGLLTEGEAPPAQLVEPSENPILSGTYRKHPRDGRHMAEVPEGIYLAGESDEPVWVDGFWIDVFPVTNADYARFVAVTGHPPPSHWNGSRCDPRLYDHPVVEVSHSTRQRTPNGQASNYPRPSNGRRRPAAPPARLGHGASNPAPRSATRARPASARPHRCRATIPASAHTASTTLSGTSGNGPAPPALPAATNSRAPPTPVRRSAAALPRSTTQVTSCTTTTQAFVASKPQA